MSPPSSPEIAIGHYGVRMPQFDAGDRYVCPLPHVGGHRHVKRIIGKTRRGNGWLSKTSLTAAYLEGMCAYIAMTMFLDWIRAVSRAPSGIGKPC